MMRLLQLQKIETRLGRSSLPFSTLNFNSNQFRRRITSGYFMRRSAPRVSPNPRRTGICGIATPAFVFISRAPVARQDYTRTPTAPRKSHMQIVARCFTVRGSNEPNLCGALLGRLAGTFVEFSGKPITNRRMRFMGIALAGTGTRRYTYMCNMHSARWAEFY